MNNLQYRIIERCLQYEYDKLYVLNVNMEQCLENIENLIDRLEKLKEDE